MPESRRTTDRSVLNVPGVTTTEAAMMVETFAEAQSHAIDELDWWTLLADRWPLFYFRWQRRRYLALAEDLGEVRADARSVFIARIFTVN